MNNQERTLQYLIEVEKIAQEILSDKREVVLLDTRRNENRVALRNLSKSTEKNCWLTVGSIIVKHDIATAKSLLEADQNQLDIDINKLRSELKVKVNKLRDLEMEPPVPGLMLVPMSHTEAEGLTNAGLFN